MAGRASIVTTRMSFYHWHPWLGDPTMADATLDRLLANHHRISAKGDSLRRLAAGKTAGRGAANLPPK
ncbi:ATP-binding protein [Aquincola tertiaricarbonis]|uniref:ATP-binding protein n=1 Tax=Aquincola tertiaricarbonis TaxID=391953 RepID=UPI0009F9D42B